MRFAAHLLVGASLFSTSVAAAQPAAPGTTLPALPAAPSKDTEPPAPPEPGPTPPAPPADEEPPAVPPAIPPAAPASPVESPPGPPAALVHQGFYFGFGSGIGHVAASGDGPFGSASLSGFGSTSSFAIGGSLARGLALAFVVEGASRSGTFDGGPQVSATTVHGGQAGTTMSVITGHSTANSFLLGGEVDWYPHAERGWHLGGALGLGGVSVSDDSGSSMGGLSVAASFFGGHQWWLGSNWSLGILGVVMGSPTIKMSDSNRNDTGYRLMPVSIGVQSLLLYY